MGSVGSSFNKEIFFDNMVDYVSGGYGLKYAVGKTGLNYILNNMEDNNGVRYRVEDNKFTGKNLKVGSEFEFTDNVRSFSKSESVVTNMLNENSDEYAGINNPAMFVVRGSHKEFDVSPYAQYYMTDQKEVLVGGRFKVVKVEKRQIHGQTINVYTINNIKRR